MTDTATKTSEEPGRSAGASAPRDGIDAASPLRSGTAPIALRLAALAALALGGAAALHAGEADVVDGAVTALGDGRYRIDATVLHADEGWDHYADRWDVLAPDGRVLGVRELAHPHENEQPFTRSLTLEIPADVTRVTLRANDSVHGTGGATLELEVPR